MEAIFMKVKTHAKTTDKEQATYAYFSPYSSRDRS